MADGKRIVMVGIPGVGKTTLVSRIAEMISGKNKSVAVHSFGTIMFEEAKKEGVSSRDDLRRLPVTDQQRFQSAAAEHIAALTDDVVIIDTHAFISTSSGFAPGLPQHVLSTIRPWILISVYARPEEIYNRRMKDETRNRDKITLDRIKKELAYQESIVSTCSVLSGAPIKPILNAEGKVDVAADRVIRAIGL